MGLKKKKTNTVGISTEYHRIVSINNIINEGTILEVCSYIDKTKRKKEKENKKTNKQMDIYLETEYISVPVEANILTIEQGYEYLKTLEQYKGATDDQVEEIVEEAKKEIVE